MWLRHNPWFLLACGLEAGLLLVALALAAGLQQSPMSGLRWRLTDLALGLAGALPSLGLFWWCVHARWACLAEIRRRLDQFVRPIFGQWSVGQLLVISVLAGLAEEILFRGVLQGAAAQYLGAAVALVATSALFGCLHWLTFAYAVLATVMGLWLGTLMLWTDNLLTPIVTHAVYDFAALVYYLKCTGREEGLKANNEFSICNKHASGLEYHHESNANQKDQ